VVVRVLLAGAAIAVLISSSAFAQRNNFDALRECEHYAALQFKRHNPAFRRFIIDRAGVSEDKFADKIGTQFVSTIYHGKATYEAASGPKRERFICLHAGYRRRPVFVYTLPE
jgi:hypothetical protein